MVVRHGVIGASLCAVAAERHGRGKNNMDSKSACGTIAVWPLCRGPFELKSTFLRHMRS